MTPGVDILQLVFWCLYNCCMGIYIWRFLLLFGRGPQFPGSHPVSLDRTVLVVNGKRAGFRFFFSTCCTKMPHYLLECCSDGQLAAAAGRLEAAAGRLAASAGRLLVGWSTRRRRKWKWESGENLQLLRQRYYYATWKADGTRYMMLITMDGCFLIDRHFNFRRVQMRFPCRHTNEGLAEKTHHFTLLDGEMVIDTLPNTQKQERRYLIYDMMALNHVSVIERPFYERWRMIDKEVIGPRNYERQHIYQSRNPYYRYELEPFRVRRKDFFLLSTVTKLLKEFIPKLSHEADGLIFQGWDDPYVPRTHEGLLKWKYPEMNSVDFLFEVVDDRELLYLHERGKKKLMEGSRVVFPDGSDPSAYSDKIIECSFDTNNQKWIWMRTRVDKGTPNDYNTYRKVMRSITDNITEEVLLNEIYEIIRLPMYADRIQSDSKAHVRRR
ncbi:hypothetical protein MTR67_048249 [Solanum verrucosum]|uniref:mRNA guanylyltransferase n=1 Tax=Solanum verrucosum TaxID=315347 RepID=A0AAF0V026_SOLVR|nr:hypothetical protein MTR67_048249 [Solanum verrucosum]